MEHLSGEIINGYQLHQYIGKGGHGAVFRAEKQATGDTVAVKVMLPQHLNDDKLVMRVQQEAEIIRDLRHPNIVSLIETWQDERGIWLVMPWLGGGDLRNYIRQHQVMSLQRLSEVLLDIAGALDAAHAAQIIHRDLKPDNILLDEMGTAYLTDFGIAKRIGYSKITTIGVVMGSPDYLSPEQIMGYDISPRTDIYALGITIYELLTGTHPFANITSRVQLMMVLMQQNLPDLTAQHIPAAHVDAVNALIKRCTAKEASERYPTASAVANHLRAIISNA